MGPGGEEDGRDEVADGAELLGGVEDGFGRGRREGGHVVLGTGGGPARDQR